METAVFWYLAPYSLVRTCQRILLPLVTASYNKRRDIIAVDLVKNYSSFMEVFIPYRIR